MPKDIDAYFSHDVLLKNSDITIYYLRCIFGSIIGSLGLAMNDPLFKTSSVLISPFVAPFAYFMYYLYHHKYYGFKFIRYLNYIIISGIIFFIIGYISGKLYIWLNENYDTDFAVIKKPLEKKDIYKKFISNFIVASSVGFIMFSSLIKKDISLIVGMSIAVTFLLPLVRAGMDYGLNNYEYVKYSMYLFLTNLFGLILSSLIRLSI